MHRTLLPAAFALATSPLAHATHGMNLDGYGAKAGGMGGAALGYDSGNSAVMNNPATLGLKPDGRSDLGLGLTVLMPDVASRHPAAGESASDGDAYYMPSLSWIHRSGPWAYGAALLAQGGMGTEYGAGSALFAGGLSLQNVPAPLSGDDIRSEVGVGRAMFPLAFRATEALTLAGQVDFVWATMDVRMDIDGRTFGALVAGTPGLGSASGSLVSAFGAAMGAGQISDVHYARFDFSDDNDFSGAAKGSGFALKLGAHYRLTETLSIGAAYHSKTRLDDLEAGRATVQMGVVAGGVAQDVPVSGRIRVLDFQWPETYGVGVAWTATPALLLVADVKRIRWADAMENFTLSFEADATQAHPLAAGLVAGGGTTLDANLVQAWKNQTMFMLGGQYMVLPNLALRAGASFSKSPVPDATLNPLFPAICRNHYTVGLGWRGSRSHSVAASLSVSPEVEQTNPNTGITSSHAQTTFRVNYNYSY